MNMLKSTDKPLVVYFHGWLSNNHTEKIKELGELFDVIAPQIPEDFDSANIAINSFLRSYRADWNRMILVGTSLGGYWANRFSNRFGMPAILINPSCEPRKTIGVDYPDIFPTNSAPKTILLASDDDVIDPTIAAELFENKAEIVWFDEGGHRFNRVVEIAKYVNDMFNRSLNYV